jgi:Na+-driven multidrug efflux pump
VYIHNIAALVLFPISMVLPNALRAAGDAKFTMFVSILAMIIFRMGAAYFFALYLNMGVIGVWIAMVFDWSFRFILFAARYLSNRWTQFRLV